MPKPSEADLVALFSGVAAYHGLDLGDTDPAVAFGIGAASACFKGYIDEDHPRYPGDELAAHNMAIRALAHYAAQTNGSFTGGDTQCHGKDRCQRLRIPGYTTCHWHGASADPDDTILANMTAAIAERTD